MSGWDLGLYYWLKNMSLLEAGVAGGVISGLIILLCQWQFGRIIRDAKKDTEEGQTFICCSTRRLAGAYSTSSEK